MVELLSPFFSAIVLKQALQVLYINARHTFVYKDTTFSLSNLKADLVRNSGKKIFPIGLSAPKEEQRKNETIFSIS